MRLLDVSCRIGRGLLMKYKILFDYDSEGYRFHEKEFDYVDEAVKKAITMHVQFFIITIINWKAIPMNGGELE